MKKIKNICLILLLIVISILSFVNYSYNTLDIIEQDKTILSIEKPETLTNNEFLIEISKCLEENNIDIMYRYLDVTGNKPLYLYYKTNVNEDFISCNSEKNSMFVNKGECIANNSVNVADKITFELKDKSLFYDFAFFNWENAAKYDLSNSNYFIKTEHINRACSILSDLGYKVVNYDSAYISGQLSVILFTAIPVILVLISFLFYVFSSTKNIVIHKMDGYSNTEIALKYIKNDFFYMIVSLISIETMTCIVGAIIYQNAFIQYIIFHIHYLVIVLATIIAAELFCFIAIKHHNNPEFIKGRIPKKGMYHLSIITKTCFFLFVIFFLTIAIRNVQIGINTYKSSKYLSSKIENYVTMPIYNHNSSIHGLGDNFLDFYQKTVDTYEGVLIDSSNYQLDSLTNTTLEEKYNQNDITINRNYLSLNPIYDLSGLPITKEMIDEKTFYVLLPSDKADISDYYTEYILNAYDYLPTIIIYDEVQTSIYSYNADTGTGDYGKIDSPVIFLIPDEALLGLFIMSYCSQGSYFLKVEASNPYEELLPILKECNLEKIILQTPYIISTFNNMINHQLYMLSIYGSQTLFITLAMIILIFFSGKVFCENHKDMISYKLIEGFSIFRIIRNHIIYILIGYICSFMIWTLLANITGVTINQLIIWGFLIFDLTYTIFVCIRFTKRNIHEIIKGAE